MKSIEKLRPNSNEAVSCVSCILVIWRIMELLVSTSKEQRFETWRSHRQSLNRYSSLCDKRKTLLTFMKTFLRGQTANPPQTGQTPFRQTTECWLILIWHLLIKTSNARYIQPITHTGTNPAQRRLTIGVSTPTGNTCVVAGQAGVGKLFAVRELTWNLSLAPFLGWPCGEGEFVRNRRSCYTFFSKGGELNWLWRLILPEVNVATVEHLTYCCISWKKCPCN